MAEKAWTVLVWIAGDNDLERYGTGDIGEMKQVGSTSDVDIVVQFDRMSDRRTRRYHLRKGTALAADQVAELGETNTGDPAVASNFFAWGMNQYPARRYLAIIWNHGSGIDETDVYRRAEAHGLTVARRGSRTTSTVPRSRLRSVASSRFRHALFRPTIDRAIRDRAVAFDDTSRDFLDNAELKRVLARVKAETRRTIDLLGFDACLMSMLEVAYQLRGQARYIVGSEEIEPLDGWPYDRILEALARNPSINAQKLGATIVKEYVKSYTGESVTLAMLDVARSKTTGEAVDELAGELIGAIRKPTEYASVAKAIRDAQHFDIPDFIDLWDLCDQLGKRSKDNGVRRAARTLMTTVAGPDGLVAAEGHKGRRVSRARGVAIYFPAGEATVAYDKLDFAKATRWDQFIDAYNTA